MLQAPEMVTLLIKHFLLETCPGEASPAVCPLYSPSLSRESTCVQARARGRGGEAEAGAELDVTASGTCANWPQLNVCSSCCVCR